MSSTAHHSLIPQNRHWVINVFTYINLKLEDWRLILRQGFFFFRIENTSGAVQGGFFPTCTFVRSKRWQFCNRHDEKFKLLSLLRFICRRLYQNYQLNNCFGLILRKDKWKAFFGLEISAASSFSGDRSVQLNKLKGEIFVRVKTQAKKILEAVCVYCQYFVSSSASYPVL